MRGPVEKNLSALCERVIFSGEYFIIPGAIMLTLVSFAAWMEENSHYVSICASLDCTVLVQQCHRSIWWILCQWLQASLQDQG